MSLIDTESNREDFMDYVYDVLSDDPTNERANLIIDFYDDLPTAYDLDKVVEQLEEKMKHHYDWDISDSHYFMARGLEEAINVVKGGGVDE